MNEKQQKNREYQLKRQYGITPTNYIIMLSMQNDACAICETIPAENERALGVDMNLNTRIVQGLLCGACRLLIASSKRNPDILRKSAEYLEKPAIYMGENPY